MDVRDHFDFIDETSIRIKGYRVYIDEVLEQHLQGKEPEKILCCFPKLPLEKIYATLLYYEANKTEVTAYLERVKQEKKKLDKEWRQTQKSIRRLVEEREHLRKDREKQIAEGKFDPIWDEPA
ncbi:MAG: DUF433 domain-containing protein [Candidatus Poribacteria bacterium]|nr:DUF433 domain-containing protein [Candidatus Poribacteria bacterium]